MIGTWRLGRSSAAVAVLSVCLAAASGAGTPAAAANVHAAYVVLAESPAGDTVPMARLVVDIDATCPRLTGGGRALPTEPRTNPHPATFPIAVCEAVYPFGEALTVEGTAITLPSVTSDPARVVVLGDSGCDGGRWQDCADVADWPFPAFAAAATRAKPDLVVHVGDFNYRGTPYDVTVDGKTEPVYDAGDGVPLADHCVRPGGYVSQNVPGSDSFDNWADWQADFFLPARPLLAAAPWVVARGNHELCSRAGPGWFYLLDPRSALLGDGAQEIACPPPGGADPLELTPPYRIELDRLSLIVLDSANACDRTPGPNVEAYTAQLKAVRSMAPDMPTWLVTHRPFWGAVAPTGSGNDATAPGGPYETLNATLQAALDRALGGELPASVRLILAGHMHRFQSLTFAGDRPPQLIVGNSGVRLMTEPPEGRLTIDVGGEPAEVLSQNAFGYLDVTLAADGRWQGRLLDPRRTGAAEVVARCGTAERSAGSVRVPTAN